MRYRITMGVVALAACLPALAVAQEQLVAATAPEAPPRREGSWELTVSAGATYLDHSFIGVVLRTDSSANRLAPGGVLRVGYNLSTMWSVSVGVGVGYTKPATVIQPFAAITWTPNINARTSPFITVGGGVTDMRWSTNGSWNLRSKYGAHVGVGFRQMLGRWTALRVEVREQVEHDSFPSGPVFNGIGTVGFSLFLGGGPLKDSDGDGVPDKYDSCPDTPAGAIVDARGCPIDSDQDGVPDGLDKCPDTPAGVQVDAMGCPLDGDGDGVPDYLDKCAATPTGVQVDTNGCPVDSDNDGVPDYLDKCPNTPADARPVDANGCPVDSDNDGVPDYLDRCPNTPAGTPVDASGCPFVAARPRPRVQADTTSRATPALAVNGTLVLRNVVFHPNSARLPPEALAGLDSLASALRDNPNARWEIGGHTSNMGDAAQNLRLSQRRALAVKTYLVRQGVPAASLVPRGYGSATPIATNATVAGRRQNMRVELTRLR